jgi:predicted enzyme related to lactoylglutathione lyase
MKNAIAWFDIPTEDFDRAVKFYSEILGSNIRVDTFMDQKLGFFPMEGTKGVGGDLVPPGMGNTPCANGTRPYLSCERIIDEVLGESKRQAERLSHLNLVWEKWAGSH